MPLTPAIDHTQALQHAFSTVSLQIPSLAASQRLIMYNLCDAEYTASRSDFGGMMTRDRRQITVAFRLDRREHEILSRMAEHKHESISHVLRQLLWSEATETDSQHSQ